MRALGTFVFRWYMEVICHFMESHISYFIYVMWSGSFENPTVTRKKIIVTRYKSLPLHINKTCILALKYFFLFLPWRIKLSSLCSSRKKPHDFETMYREFIRNSQRWALIKGIERCVCRKTSIWRKLSQFIVGLRKESVHQVC